MHLEYKNVGEHAWERVEVNTKTGSTYISVMCSHSDCRMFFTTFESTNKKCPSKRMQRVVGEWEPEDMVRDPSQKIQPL